MKTRLKLLTRVAVMAAAAVVLASCYAPLAGQSGHFNLSIKGFQAKGSTTNVLVLVVDSGYQAALAETLLLTSKGIEYAGLSSTDADRLTELGKELSTNALVKFGGVPFYQVPIDPATGGSFDIPGVPADRSYLVKIFVLQPGVNFEVKNLDANFFDLVQLTNWVFNTDDSYNFGTYPDFTVWIPSDANGLPNGQPVTVNAGETVDLTVTLNSPPNAG